jgi:hypothetical protein
VGVAGCVSGSLWQDAAGSRRGTWRAQLVRLPSARAPARAARASNPRRCRIRRGVRKRHAVVHDDAAVALATASTFVRRAPRRQHPPPIRHVVVRSRGTCSARRSRDASRHEEQRHAAATAARRLPVDGPASQLRRRAVPSDWCARQPPRHDRRRVTLYCTRCRRRVSRRHGGEACAARPLTCSSIDSVKPRTLPLAPSTSWPLEKARILSIELLSSAASILLAILHGARGRGVEEVQTGGARL